MTYLVFWLLAGLVAGISAEQYSPDAALWIAASSAVSALGLFIFARQQLRLLMSAVVMAWLGISCVQKTVERPAFSVEERVPLECASLEGVVEDLPAVSLNGRRSRVRFVLASERLLSLEDDCIEFSTAHIRKVEGRIQVFLVNPPDVPDPGDRIRIFGRLQKPRAPRNPGEMDYGHYLAGQGIFAIFSGLGPASMRVIEPGSSKSLNAAIQRTRKNLAGRIDQAFDVSQDTPQTMPYAELLKALLLGLRSQFPEDLWRQMMRTGTAHLVSISGLHMNVFSAAVYSLGLLLLKSPRRAAWTALIFSGVYMVLAGSGLPVQRAALMGAAAYAGFIFERESRALHLLAWAALVLLLREPLALESVSFQLSFLSVFLLLILRYLPPLPALLEHLRAAAFLLAGTLPAAASHFHMVSWTALPANLWAIPFFNLALLTGMGTLASGGIPFLGWLFAALSTLCLKAGIAGIRFMAGWPWGWSLLAQPEIWKILHYYAWGTSWFCLSCFFPQQFHRVRAAVLAGWLGAGVLFWLPGSSAPWSVTFLAGAQQPLAHLQAGTNHWLINPGRSFPSNETGRIVLPYLRSRGLMRIDGLILTSYPGRLADVLVRLQEEIKIKNIWGPLPLRPPVNFLPGLQNKWKRLSLQQGVDTKRVSVRAFFSRTAWKLITIHIKDGPHFFMVNGVDRETQQALESRLKPHSIVILYGPAASRHPAAEAWRVRLSGLCRPPVLIFSGQTPATLPGSSGSPQNPKAFFLGQAGKILPNSAGEIWLQFYAGQQVKLL